MFRDLGRDVPDLEKLYARELWAVFFRTLKNEKGSLRDHSCFFFARAGVKTEVLLRVHLEYCLPAYIKGYSKQARGQSCCSGTDNVMHSVALTHILTVQKLHV